MKKLTRAQKKKLISLAIEQASKSDKEIERFMVFFKSDKELLKIQKK